MSILLKTNYIFFLVIFIVFCQKSPRFEIQNKKYNEILIKDSATNLLWAKNYSVNKSWEDAKTYCDNLIYGKYKDWRLPFKEELVTLLNKKRYNPASDFPDIPGAGFWTSTLFETNNNYAWSVLFGSGYIAIDARSNKINAICVRKL